MKNSKAFAIAAMQSLLLCAQQTSPAPTFEVVSIRPAPPISPAIAAGGKMHVGMKEDQSRVDIGYTSIHELIRMAYDVRRYQISGPDWMTKDYWDILAKMPDGASADRIPQMLQALLADRFGLKVHRQTRNHKVYALMVGKVGANLQPTPSSGDQKQDNILQVSAARDGRSTTVTGAGAVSKTEMHPDGSMHLEYSKMTMALLGDVLGYYLDRPVLDLTNLPGSYIVNLDFSAADLRFASDKAAAGAVAESREASEPVGASLINSIQKLGLRLEKQQAPVEFIVVDRVNEAPTAN